jgi:tryptophan-rich sensory protein
MIKKRVKTSTNRETKIWCFLLVFLTAGIGFIFSSANSRSLWYDTIKPVITPPSWIFPVVWTILYILIAISLYLAWINSRGRQKLRVGLIFGINLLANMFWSFFFFFLKNPLWGFYDIVLIWLTIIFMFFICWRSSRLSAWLLLPYFIWVSYASLVNLFSI